MSARMQAVLIGGVFIGVLSALPVVSIANCCCLWVIGGGAVAAYLLQQGQPHPIEVGDGALVGCLAGVCGSFVYALVSIPVQLMMGPIQQQMADILRGNAEVPPEVVEMIDQFGTATPIAILFGFVFMLGVGVIFGTLGGLLGAFIFRKGPSGARRRRSPPPGGVTAGAVRRDGTTSSLPSSLRSVEEPVRNRDDDRTCH